MDSIFYLVRKTVKNAVIDVFRHPLMLVMYGVFFLSIISAVLMGYANSTATYSVEKDTRALYGGYLALLHFISIPIMLKGSVLFGIRWNGYEYIQAFAARRCFADSRDIYYVHFGADDNIDDILSIKRTPETCQYHEIYHICNSRISAGSCGNLYVCRRNDGGKPALCRITAHT